MILQRLNMDNAWFLELAGLRLVIDPWLEGEEVDYFTWFNTQWLRTPPVSYGDVPAFDAVLITQKYPDHLHEQTLKRLNPTTVLAPDFLESRLEHILPNATIRSFSEEARSQRLGEVRITHLSTRRRLDPIYDAYFLEHEDESVLIANHGFQIDDGHRADLGHDGQCEILLSTFNLYSLPKILGGLVSPGLDGLAALMEQTKPRKVVQTHDELKHAKGLIPALAHIVPFDPNHVENHPWLHDRYLHIPDYTPVTP